MQKGKQSTVGVGWVVEFGVSNAYQIYCSHDPGKRTRGTVREVLMDSIMC
jgi:hypothetical protein